MPEAIELTALEEKIVAFFRSPEESGMLYFDRARFIYAVRPPSGLEPSSGAALMLALTELRHIFAKEVNRSYLSTKLSRIVQDIFWDGMHNVRWQIVFFTILKGEVTDHA